MTNEALKGPFSKDKILIFDLDDTLVISAAKIKVCDTSTNKCFELTPEEFNSYQRSPKHLLNFDDFKSLEVMKAGKLIQKYLDILSKNYRAGNAIGIISARDDEQMIYTWMKEHVGFHIHPELIWCINDPHRGLTGSIAERKKQAMRWFIEQGFTDISFFDDDKNNIKLIDQLANELQVQIKTHLAKH
jgi:hypothetical protein